MVVVGYGGGAGLKGVVGKGRSHGQGQGQGQVKYCEQMDEQQSLAYDGGSGVEKEQGRPTEELK